MECHLKCAGSIHTDNKVNKWTVNSNLPIEHCHYSGGFIEIYIIVRSIKEYHNNIDRARKVHNTDDIGFEGNAEKVGLYRDLNFLSE